MIRLSPLDLPASGDQESTWSNPAKLSRKVRELANRVLPGTESRDTGRTPRPPVDSERYREDLQ